MTVVINGTSGITGNTGTLISASTIGVGGATPSASGAGITFPATLNASTDPNTLDDYEEGTWTPEVWVGSTQITSPTSVAGYYRKIGATVWLGWYFYKSSGATGSAAQWQIRNLPFSLGITVAGTNAVPATYMAMNGANTTQVARWQANSSTALDLYGQYNNTAWSSSYLEFGGCGVFAV